MFEKLERTHFLASPFYRVYVWILALLFRLGPTLLLAFLNLRIIAAYRRTCRNRRRMTGETERGYRSAVAGWAERTKLPVNNWNKGLAGI